MPRGGPPLIPYPAQLGSDLQLEDAWLTISVSAKVLASTSATIRRLSLPSVAGRRYHTTPRCWLRLADKFDPTGLGSDASLTTRATRLLKGRIARQVWRDYHKHAFARRCYADPSDANLAEQHRARKQHEDERTEREELVLARTFLAWRRGMG